MTVASRAGCGLTVDWGTALPTLLNAFCQVSCISGPGVSCWKLADAGVAVIPGVTKPNEPASEHRDTLRQPNP